MDAFPDCPQEFRPTLERLLGLLNETQTAVSSALNKQLTRAENMRGGYVTISGTTDSSGFLIAQARNPLPIAPRAIYGARVERLDGLFGEILWSLSSWRSLGDGMIEIHVVGLDFSVPYRITCIVE